MTETEIFSQFEEFHNQHQIPPLFFQVKSVIWTLVTDVRFKFPITSVIQSTVLGK